MRRLFFSLMLGCFTFLFFSCNKEIPKEQDEYITIPFSFVRANISDSDEPLDTKSGEGTEYTYVINVLADNPNLGFTGYARGVFSSSPSSIRVKIGKQYRFQVAVFKDYFKSGHSLNLYNKDSTYYAANNKFVYDNGIFEVLRGGIGMPFRDANSGSQLANFWGETFYGELDGFTATSTTAVEISLSRVSAFLEIDIIGMLEGSISTNIGHTFTYPETTYSTWITDASFYAFETFPQFQEQISFQYHAPNETVTDLGSTNVTFIRNHKKTIILNLTYETQNPVPNSMSITLPSTPLDETDEDEVIDKVI